MQNWEDGDKPLKYIAFIFVHINLYIQCNSIIIENRNCFWHTNRHCSHIVPSAISVHLAQWLSFD